MKEARETMESEDTKVRNLIVRIADRLFGLDIRAVQEMFELPSLTPLPRVSERIRGVINLRGRVVPVIDLRITLGYPPLQNEIDELCEHLDQRQADHNKWLNELEASVREQRPFKLQTDPHKCAFGRWYDTYETSNRQVMVFLERFDGPHKRIHGIAQKTTELVAEGKADEAQEIIERTRNGDLAVMNQLFQQLREMVRSSTREVAVLLKQGEDEFAVSVDEVLAVEDLEEIDDRNAVLESCSAEKFAAGIAKRSEGELVIKLNAGYLLDGLVQEGALAESAAQAAAKAGA